MATPQDGYPPQGYGDQYAQQPQYNEEPQQPGFAPPSTTGHPENEGTKKKKRGYAAQAYDFGAGANSTLGGQPQAGGQFLPAQAPAYGGYPAAPEVQPAAYGAQPAYMTAGSPAPVQQVYGQNSPAMGGYPNQGAGYAPAAADVAGITQGMGHMGMGYSAPAQGPGSQPNFAQPTVAPNQAGGRPAVLNQLYPTDLLNQPFNVAELDLPPPPIILPPNVRSNNL